MSVRRLPTPTDASRFGSTPRMPRSGFEGDRVGFDHQQPVDGGVVRVLLEKDFACIDRPAGEEADDAYAFPNPSAIC